MLTRGRGYPDLYKSFRWRIPRQYNIGVDMADKHPARDIAMLHVLPDGAVQDIPFGHLRAQSNRLANALIAKGFRRGDRVAILAGQRPEAMIALAGIAKAGMIAVPLDPLTEVEGLRYRLTVTAARGLIGDAAGLAALTPILQDLADLGLVLALDQADMGTTSFQDILDRSSDAFQAPHTLADDPALILFTQGTRGRPKPVLHAHRALLGQLPGLEFALDFLPDKGDRLWTSFPWSSRNGLLGAVLPALHHGVPVLVWSEAAFDPEKAFALLARNLIRNAVLPLGILRAMGRVSDPQGRFRPRLRSIASAGASLPPDIQDWGRSTFGLTMNEVYSQTETGPVIANNSTAMELRPGSMGRAVPGHQVAVVDEEGRELPPGETGMIAVRRGDPGTFLGYWNDDVSTVAKYVGPWLATGDLGRRDHTGYFWYVDRGDEVIVSGGYRIGPGEVESCLMRHPAVKIAAAIGVPDTAEGEVVKAIVVLKPGRHGDNALNRELQDFARRGLAAQSWPRAIEFVSDLPMTASGRVLRGAVRAEYGNDGEAGKHAAGRGRVRDMGH